MKPLRTTVSLFVVMTTCLLGACSQQDPHRAYLTQLQAAVDALKEAEKGFIPKDVVTDEDLEGYRQEKLQAAFTKLESVAAKGPQDQQVAVRIMLADIQLSQSRHLMRQALLAASDVSPRSTTLVALAIAADQAAGRARALEGDESEYVKQLAQDQTDLNRRLQQIRSDSSTLKEQINQLTAAINQLAQTRMTELERAQQLKTKAFAMAGEERYAVYDQATEAERAAQTAEAKSQQESVKLSVFVAEAAILETHEKLAAQAAEKVTTMLQVAQQRQTQREQQRDTAIQQRDEIVRDLTEKYTQVAKDFNQQVEGRFEQATAAVQKAIEQLVIADSSARGNDKRKVAQHLLAARSELAMLLGQSVSVSHQHGLTLHVLAVQAPRIAPDQKDLMEGTYVQVQQRHDTLLSNASGSVGEAMGLAATVQESAAADDPAAQQAKLDYETLRVLSSRIGESTLPKL